MHKIPCLEVSSISVPDFFATEDMQADSSDIPRSRQGRSYLHSQQYDRRMHKEEVLNICNSTGEGRKLIRKNIFGPSGQSRSLQLQHKKLVGLTLKEMEHALNLLVLVHIISLLREP